MANALLTHDYPYPSSPAARRRMLANRRRDTGPEVRLRSLLHKAGLRFRCDYPVRVGDRATRVDIVFPRRHVAIFVDGCFWHCCPEHGTVPVANRDYWVQKLMRTSERDREVNEALRVAGWTVLRFWEHTASEEAAAAISRRIAQES
jgi:DNA mismatch endonuclease, patch repair protein